MKEDVSRVEDKDYKIRYEKMAERERERSTRKESRKEEQRIKQREAARREREFRDSLGDTEKVFLFIGRILIILGALAVGLFFGLFRNDSVNISWKFTVAAVIVLVLGLFLVGILRFINIQRSRFLPTEHSKRDLPTKHYQPLPEEYYQPVPKQTDTVITTLPSFEDKPIEIMKEIIPTTVLKEQIQSETPPEIQPETQLEIETPSKISIRKILSEVASENLKNTCMICTSQILKGEKYIRCHSCSKLAHLDHMNEWLQVKPIGPECGIKLKSSLCFQYLIINEKKN